MKYLQIVGAVFTMILGTLLHFTYDWCKKNVIIGIFSATNESTWEHLKLLAMPILLFGIIEYFAYGRKIINFIPVKAISIILGMSVIVFSFYTYVFLVGRHFLWVDISIFFLGVAASYIFSAYFLHQNQFSSVFSVSLGWIGIILIFASFIIFTFYPPHIGLFLDPVSMRYNNF